MDSASSFSGLIGLSLNLSRQRNLLLLSLLGKVYIDLVQIDVFFVVIIVFILFLDKVILQNCQLVLFILTDVTLGQKLLLAQL